MFKGLFTILTLFASATLVARTFNSVRDLSSAFGAWEDDRTPFSIVATVTAPTVFDRLQAAIPLSDGTGFCAIRGNLPAHATLPELGDRIRITGTLRRRDAGFPSATFTSIQILERGTDLPRPTSVSIAQLRTGAHDWRYARITGLVCDVLPSDTNANWIFLVLCADGSTITVTLPLNDTPHADFGALLRKTVSIDGFCCPQDGSLRLYQGRIFQARGLSAITLDTTVRDDPFAAQDVRGLRFRHPAEIAASGMARARGVVISRWGEHDGMLQLQDGDCLHFVCGEGPLPPRGASVEVAGFPQSDLFHITLRHALWRKTDPIPITSDKPLAISPARLQVEAGINAGYLARLHGKTIRFTARVRNLPEPLLRKNTLLVEDDANLISVDVSMAPKAVEGLEAGALVDLTATCVLSTQAWSPSLSAPQIRGFTAVLNTAADLRLVEGPPWWTLGRILSAAGLVIALLVVLLVCGYVSRARALLKTTERTRLAVELHDTLSQSLTGVSLELQAARNAQGVGSPVMSEHLDTAARVLASCRQELKNCLWDLRNRALEETHFENAIRTTLRPLADDSSLAIRFILPRSRLSDPAAHALLRVIRELVINALRHGEATRIRIAGCIDQGNIRCSVSDNGHGFDPATAPGVLQGHFGLQGLRERLAEHHGTITIASQPGKGAKATITLPTDT